MNFDNVLTSTKNGGRKIDFFNGLLNSTSDIILAIDRTYRIIAINNAARMATQLNWGSTAEIGTSIIDILPPHERERSKVLYESILRGEPTEREHLEMVSPKGGIQHYEMTYYLITDENGDGAGIAMFIRDITDLFETQKKLREKQAELEKFMNAMPMGVFVITKDGVPHFANETAKEMLGKGIMPEKNASDLSEVYDAYKFGTEERYPVQQMPIVRALSGEASEVDDMEIRNGEKRLQLEVKSTPIYSESGQLEYAIAAFKDATARKQAEQKLRESAIRLLEAQRVASIGDFDFNLATGELKWSEEEYNVFGVEKSVTPNFDVFVGAIHPDDRARIISEFQTALGNPTVRRITLNFRVIHSSGELRYTNGEVVIVRNEQGAPIRAYGTNQDITVQKVAEEKLRQNEENFRKTVSSVPGMIYQFTILPDGTIQMPYVSEGCRELYGLEPEAVMENPMVLFAMMNPDDIAASQVAIAESAANMTPFIYETRYTLPNGKKIWTRYHGKPTKREDGLIVWYGVCTDITEQKTLEAELQARLIQIQETQNHLIQSEKMSALGQMVAGIAHELNTPIGYASNNVAIIRDRFNALTALLRQAIEAQESVYAGQLETAFEKMQSVSNSPNGTLGELDETLRRTERLFTGVSTGFEQMTNLVRSMRNFSRLDEADMKKADINEGVKGCLLMVGHMLKDKDVELTTEYGVIPQVDCFPAQLNQVFLNLVGNAIHAVEEKPNGHVHVQTSFEENSVVVRIIDNGKGIPKHAQKKIFDPFFTTKPVGKGTGLGLSISYDIVKKHNGELSFETEEGVGTTFIVRIPAVEFMAESLAQA
jgi:PAS domain S-box-containing protein